jgi:hypothetical protein
VDDVIYEQPLIRMKGGQNEYTRFYGKTMEGIYIREVKISTNVYGPGPGAQCAGRHRSDEPFRHYRNSNFHFMRLKAGRFYKVVGEI